MGTDSWVARSRQHHTAGEHTPAFSQSLRGKFPLGTGDLAVPTLKKVLDFHYAKDSGRDSMGLGLCGLWAMVTALKYSGRRTAGILECARARSVPELASL